MAVMAQWLKLFKAALGEAVAGGELPSDTDIDQMAFELNAMLVRANFDWILTGEPTVLDRARAGIRHVIERATGHKGSEPQPSRRRAARERTRSRA